MASVGKGWSEVGRERAIRRSTFPTLAMAALPLISKYSDILLERYTKYGGLKRGGTITAATSEIPIVVGKGKRKSREKEGKLKGYNKGKEKGKRKETARGEGGLASKKRITEKEKKGSAAWSPEMATADRVGVGEDKGGERGMIGERDRGAYLLGGRGFVGASTGHQRLSLTASHR